MPNMKLPPNSSVLFDSQTIRSRILEIAEKVRKSYASCDLGEIEMVWIAEGARHFADALFNAMNLSIKTRSIKVSSYGKAFESSGDVKIYDSINDIKARRVLLVDDILDTGLTAKTVIAKLKSNGVEEVKTCFLLNKAEKNKGCLKPDFEGFEIPDKYVFGFGLDIAGEYRDLPDIMAFDY